MSSAAPLLYRHAIESFLAFATLGELLWCARVCRERNAATRAMRSIAARWLVPDECRSMDFEPSIELLLLSPLRRHVTYIGRDSSGMLSARSGVVARLAQQLPWLQELHWNLRCASAETALLPPSEIPPLPRPRKLLLEVEPYAESSDDMRTVHLHSVWQSIAAGALPLLQELSARLAVGLGASRFPAALATPALPHTPHADRQRGSGGTTAIAAEPGAARCQLAVLR